MTPIEKLNKAIDKAAEKVGELRLQIAPLQEQMAPLQQALSEAITYRDKLVGEREALEIAEVSNAGELRIDWLFDGNASGPKYKYQISQLAKLGLNRGGFWIGTGQTAITLWLNQNDETQLEKILESLTMLLPHIKAHTNYEYAGYKMIGIFDYRLSDDGGWNLGIDDFKVVLFNKRRVRMTFPSLQDALKYCQEHHPHEIKG